MTDFNFACANCGTKLNLIVQPAPGEVIPCPACGQPFTATAQLGSRAMLVGFGIFSGFVILAVFVAVVVYSWAKNEKDPSVAVEPPRSVNTQEVAQAPQEPQEQPEPSAPALLGYKWKLGQTFRYEISMEANGRSFQGVNTYEVATIDGRTKLAFLGRRQFKQTGFVVSDRFIVTNARSLRWASHVELWVKDKVYPAKLFAMDKSIDLAVLQLDAPGLQPLPLAEDSVIATGDEVWLVNCDAANSLVKSVNRVKGQITEVVRSESHTQISIQHWADRVIEDAVVLNAEGQWIGVVGRRDPTDSESLVRAIAVESVSDLLKQYGIQVVGDRQAQDSKPKSMLARTRPALVQLEVTIDPSAATKSQRYTLSTKSRFLPFDDSGDNLLKKSVSALMNALNQKQGNLVVDELGNLLDKKSTTPLPFLLGPAEQLPFVPFSASGKRTWQKHELLVVGLSSLSSKTNERVYAHREIRYEIEEVSGGKVTIGMDVSVKSLGWEVAATGVHLSGTGRAVFDFENGTIESNQLSLIYDQKVDSKLTTFPVEISSTLAGDEAIAKADSADDSITSTASSLQEQAARLDDLLFRLSETQERAECAEIISGIIELNGLPEHREQVIRKCLGLLLDRNVKIRNVGIRAVGRCGDPNTANLISRHLADEDSVNEAVEALLALNHEKADAVLISALFSRRHGFRRENNRMVRVEIEPPVIDVFRKMGKSAEPVLLRLLDRADNSRKSAILALLGEVGGKATVVHLEQLLSSGVEDDRTRASMELVLSKLNDQRPLPKDPSSLIATLNIAKTPEDIVAVLDSLLELDIEPYQDVTEQVSAAVRSLRYRVDDAVYLKALRVMQKWRHNDDFVNALIPLTRRTESPDVQKEALSMLCLDKTPAATRSLIISMRHGDAHVTDAVVSGLKRIGDTCESGLLPLIQYHDEQTVAKICEILAVSGGDKTVRRIEEILESGVFDSRTLTSFKDVLRSLQPQSRWLSITEPNVEQLSPEDAAAALDLSKPLTTQLSALMSLAEASPTEPPRSEVAKRLNRFMNHEHPTIRTWTFRVLHTWSSAETISAIEEILNSDNDFARWAAIDAIPYAYHDKTAAARAIAARIQSGHVDSWWANRAILAIGRPAEHALLELLTETPSSVNISAMYVLGKVGGPDSIARLKELALAHASLKFSATRSVKKIEERLQAEKEPKSNVE